MKLTILLMLVVLSTAVLAVDFDTGPSAADKAAFDKILEPVMKIYNFVKYAATVIAVMMFVFAGITFITAGGDVGKRKEAKNIAAYTVVGLVVIWAAPLVVEYLV